MTILVCQQEDLDITLLNILHKVTIEILGVGEKFFKKHGKRALGMSSKTVQVKKYVQNDDLYQHTTGSQLTAKC